MSRGVFIVIEGSDGSGKGTQFKQVAKRLIDHGYEIATYDFPQYNQPSSIFVREYLNGLYGKADDLGAYAPSLFFALDRFRAAESIKKNLDAGKIVLSNRFIAANMAHQGQKIHDESERKRYYEWLFNIEYDILGIPRPDLNIVLTVPAPIAQKYIDKKEARSYTDKKRDIHEDDLNHLKRAIAAYQELCKRYPDRFTSIQCAKNGKMLPIPKVTDLVWEKIQKVLPN